MQAVVPIANPEATAQFALELLGNEATWYAAQQAGIKRVETFYTQKDMFANYRAVYRTALSAVERSD